MTAKTAYHLSDAEKLYGAGVDFTRIQLMICLHKTNSLRSLRQISENVVHPAAFFWSENLPGPL